MNTNNNNMGVIFDLDGVLVDTGWAHRQAWYDLAAKESFDFTDEFFYSTFGMPNYRIMPMLAGSHISAGEIERLSNWKESRYREIIETRITLADEVRKLLIDLAAAHFSLAIGSSAPRDNLEMILRRTGLDDYIKVYVTKEEITHGKPAPDTFLRAAEKLTLPAARCVVVEDAIQGIEAAKAAGMKVIAVATTRKRTDLKTADLIVNALG